MDEGKSLLSISSSSDYNNDAFMKLLQKQLNVDVMDENGMTPLMHTAYHGHLQACRELLRRGADVNNNKQKDGFTALMFAAVAGKCEVVKLLLHEGAEICIVNNLGKTATNMAAFVGHHKCAQVMTNYFSLSELNEYTKVGTSPSSGPHLPPSLATPLHSLLVSTHLHPVKILLRLHNDDSALLEHYSAVRNVLSSIELKMVKDSCEHLALKIHYLSYLIQLAHTNGVDQVTRRMLSFDEDGKAVNMDMLLRQCLREFPYPHLPFFKQMVSSLAKIPPGRDPTSYILILSVVLGDKGAVAGQDSCYTCGWLSSSPSDEGEDTLKKCSRCKRAWYCSVKCQQLAWNKGNHKKLCKLWATSLSS